jgi:hypothetical protein
MCLGKRNIKNATYDADIGVQSQPAGLDEAVWRGIDVFVGEGEQRFKVVHDVAGGWSYP